MTSENVQVLKICAQIRNVLQKEGITELPLNFPIQEMPWEATTKYGNYLGMTYYEKASGTGAYFTQIPQKVLVRLKNTKGVALPLVCVIPVLLHEFAHCITKVELPANTRNKKMKKMNTEHAHHNVDFYKNFARILRLAEALCIFQLPSSPGKLNMSALQRYDKIDFMETTVDLIGCTKITCLADVERVVTASKERDQNEVVADDDGPINLSVTNSAGRAKLLVLKNRKELTLENLQKKIRQKFQKKPKKLLFTNGTVMTREDVLKLSNLDKILIA